MSLFAVARTCRKYSKLNNSGADLSSLIFLSFFMRKTAEKEVQDTSSGGLGVSPSFKKSPKIGG